MSPYTIPTRKGQSGENGTHENGLMGRNRNWVVVVGRHQNDVGEARRCGPLVLVRGPRGESEEGDLGLEIFDLSLELLLRLAGLLVTLPARAGVARRVLLPARHALHRSCWVSAAVLFRVGVRSEFVRRSPAVASSSHFFGLVLFGVREEFGKERDLGPSQWIKNWTCREKKKNERKI